MDTKCSAAAKALHWDFLKGLLGSQEVCSELGSLSWVGSLPIASLQIQHCYQMANALGNVRFLKHAMVDGFASDQTAGKDN